MHGCKRASTGRYKIELAPGVTWKKVSKGVKRRLSVLPDCLLAVWEADKPSTATDLAMYTRKLTAVGEGVGFKQLAADMHAFYLANLPDAAP